MDKEQIKKIIDDTYDESRENSLFSMLRDFYNRKMIVPVFLTWFYFILLAVVAVYCAMKFFDAEQVKPLIMYAALFISCMVWLNLIKIWAWQMIHRNNIKREIKRLELRIAELIETVKNK